MIILWTISQAKEPEIAHTVQEQRLTDVVDSDEILQRDIVDLIQRHNDDFSRVLETRDQRYLKATTIEKGHIQALEQITNFLEYMQRDGITSSFQTNLRIVNWREISKDRVESTIDETWKEIYSDGHITHVNVRNIYRLVFLEGAWLVDSCEILRPG